MQTVNKANNMNNELEMEREMGEPEAHAIVFNKRNA
jgi:hypothetical protein